MFFDHLRHPHVAGASVLPGYVPASIANAASLIDETVIAILCLCLDKKPLSAYGQNIKAITLFSPTTFPIVYAAILGKFLRRIGLFKAERSSKIGVRARMDLAMLHMLTTPDAGTTHRQSVILRSNRETVRTSSLQLPGHRHHHSMASITSRQPILIEAALDTTQSRDSERDGRAPRVRRFPKPDRDGHSHARGKLDPMDALLYDGLTNFSIELR